MTATITPVKQKRRGIAKRQSGMKKHAGGPTERSMPYQQVPPGNATGRPFNLGNEPAGIWPEWFNQSKLQSTPNINNCSNNKQLQNHNNYPINSQQPQMHSNYPTKRQQPQMHSNYPTNGQQQPMNSYYPTNGQHYVNNANSQQNRDRMYTMLANKIAPNQLEKPQFNKAVRHIYCHSCGIKPHKELGYHVQHSLYVTVCHVAPVNDPYHCDVCRRSTVITEEFIHHVRQGCSGPAMLAYPSQSFSNQPKTTSGTMTNYSTRCPNVYPFPPRHGVNQQFSPFSQSPHPRMMTNRPLRPIVPQTHQAPNITSNPQHIQDISPNKHTPPARQIPAISGGIYPAELLHNVYQPPSVCPPPPAQTYQPPLPPVQLSTRDVCPSLSLPALKDAVQSCQTFIPPQISAPPPVQREIHSHILASGGSVIQSHSPLVSPPQKSTTDIGPSPLALSTCSLPRDVVLPLQGSVGPQQTYLPVLQDLCLPRSASINVPETTPVSPEVNRESEADAHSTRIVLPDVSREPELNHSSTLAASPDPSLPPAASSYQEDEAILDNASWMPDLVDFSKVLNIVPEDSESTEREVTVKTEPVIRVTKRRFSAYLDLTEEESPTSKARLNSESLEQEHINSSSSSPCSAPTESPIQTESPAPPISTRLCRSPDPSGYPGPSASPGLCESTGYYPKTESSIPCRNWLPLMLDLTDREVPSDILDRSPQSSDISMPSTALHRPSTEIQPPTCPDSSTPPATHLAVDVREPPMLAPLDLSKHASKSPSISPHRCSPVTIQTDGHVQSPRRSSLVSTTPDMLIPSPLMPQGACTSVTIPGPVLTSSPARCVRHLPTPPVLAIDVEDILIISSDEGDVTSSPTALSPIGHFFYEHDDVLSQLVRGAAVDIPTCASSPTVDRITEHFEEPLLSVEDLYSSSSSCSSLSMTSTVGYGELSAPTTPESISFLPPLFPHDNINARSAGELTPDSGHVSDWGQDRDNVNDVIEISEDEEDNPQLECDVIAWE